MIVKVFFFLLVICCSVCLSRSALAFDSEYRHDLINHLNTNMFWWQFIDVFILLNFSVGFLQL